jgi:hypothetical protein
MYSIESIFNPPVIWRYFLKIAISGVFAGNPDCRAVRGLDRR